MRNIDALLQDDAISHQISLLRFTAGEQKKVLAILNQMTKELTVKLQTDLTDFGRARVNKLLRESNVIINAAYNSITPTGLTESKIKYKKIAPGFYSAQEGNIGIGLYKSETGGFWSSTVTVGEYGDADWQEEVFQGLTKKEVQESIDTFVQKRSNTPTDFHGLAESEAKGALKPLAGVGISTSLPSETALKALVNGSLIEGAPSAAWWAKQSDTVAFNFAAQVRQGVAQGETVQQIVRRIAGSPRLGIPGIMAVSRRDAAALVHTSIQQVANDARLATFKANDDIIKGVRQLSTLDSHTTKICIGYSGAEWDLSGKPIKPTTLPFNGGPPRHWNCRSLLIAITKSYKELGIDVPEVPKGTRASDEGQISANITMSGFLKNKPKAYVDDLLGPGRSKLFLDRKITLPQLLDFSGNPLTLDELKLL